MGKGRRGRGRAPKKEDAPPRRTPKSLLPSFQRRRISPKERDRRRKISLGVRRAFRRTPRGERVRRARISRALVAFHRKERRRKPRKPRKPSVPRITVVMSWLELWDWLTSAPMVVNRAVVLDTPWLKEIIERADWTLELVQQLWRTGRVEGEAWAIERGLYTKDNIHYWVTTEHFKIVSPGGVDAPGSVDIEWDRAESLEHRKENI